MIKYLLALASLAFFGLVIACARFAYPIYVGCNKLIAKLFKKEVKEFPKERSEGWKKAERIVINYVLIGTAMAVFAVRFMCYDDIQWISGWENYIKIGAIPQGKGAAVFGELCLWLIVPANLLVYLRAFFKEKTVNWFNKFIALPIIFVTIICMKQTEINMIGVSHNVISEFTLVEILFPIELGALLALSIYFFIKDFKERIDVKDYHFVGIMAVIGCVFAIPPFLPMFFFGVGKAGHYPYDISVTHRLVIYILFIALPLLIYFFLRDKSQTKINFSLTFITLSAMVAFMYANKISKIDEPWNYPWHLCNTAMFILPLCMIFKPKRLFYFTYFINVFGALMATLMPNYSSTSLLFEPDVVRFIMNHTMAFWMPLLMVALKVYERPKFKQYLYSTIWLLVYFLAMLFLNSYFNAKGHETDFFFIYTDKIADKLGKWAERIYEKNIIVDVKGLKMTFRPLYQSLYLAGYIGLGFAMWFVYSLFFRIADSHYELHCLLKVARKGKIDMRIRKAKEVEENLTNGEITLIFDEFTKRYGNSPVLSADHISFKVSGGMIFGFLGPNGAGKSTCIKSAIGIQPVTDGHIFVCGHDVTIEPVKAKKLIGYVPDHYALYEKLTGREYINYIADLYKVSKKDRDERITYYVNLFELTQAFDNRMQTYSHGMKQKIAIMAALVHNPKIWILDEPLTGLDPQSIFQVKQCMIRHAQEGNIVFFSSHIIDVVEKMCTDIAIVQKGHIVYQASMKQVEKEHPEGLETFYLSTIKDNGDLDIAR